MDAWCYGRQGEGSWEGRVNQQWRTGHGDERTGCEENKYQGEEFVKDKSRAVEVERGREEGEGEGGTSPLRLGKRQ